MCTIETFDIVYPNGARERREQLVNCCARGTPNRPCRDVRYVNTFHERPASVAELRAVGAGPHIETITPRGSERSASHPGSRDKQPGLLGEIVTGFKNWKRSSWGKSGKAGGAKLAFVRPGSRNRRPRAPITDYPVPMYPPPPRAPSPPRWQPRPAPPRQSGSATPHIIPIRPSHEQERQRERGRRREPERGTRRRRSQQRAVIHQSSSEEETPSPPTASREHQRSRSLSPNSRYVFEKRQRDREQRQYAEMVAQEQQAAHRRAERLAEFQRLDAERLRQERIEFEERKRIESAERARRRRDRGDYEREQARTRQELADVQRIAAGRAQRLRVQEEAERRARERRANVPLRPRHPPAVHHPESLEARGERYIHDAIRAANLRQFDRRSPPSAGRRNEGYGGGDLRRHNTTDGTHRGRYGGDHPWNSR